MTKIISVFGSSAPEPGSAAFAEARQVGRLLAEAGFVAATGGYGGTMTAVSQGASEAGGHVIGVTSAQIERFRPLRANKWVAEEIKYESLRDRLVHLVMQNDGMIVLPGGIGTLSEMALAWSFLQVGEVEKRPFALLGDLWRDSIQVFYRPEYVKRPHLDLLFYADTPATAVTHIAEFWNGKA